MSSPGRLACSSPPPRALPLARPLALPDILYLMGQYPATVKDHSVTRYYIRVKIILNIFQLIPLSEGFIHISIKRCTCACIPMFLCRSEVMFVKVWLFMFV